MTGKIYIGAAAPVLHFAVVPFSHLIIISVFPPALSLTGCEVHLCQERGYTLWHFTGVIDPERITSLLGPISFLCRFGGYVDEYGSHAMTGGLGFDAGPMTSRLSRVRDISEAGNAESKVQVNMVLKF